MTWSTRPHWKPLNGCNNHCRRLVISRLGTITSFKSRDWAISWWNDADVQCNMEQVESRVVNYFVLIFHQNYFLHIVAHYLMYWYNDNINLNFSIIIFIRLLFIMGFIIIYYLFCSMSDEILHLEQECERLTNQLSEQQVWHTLVISLPRINLNINIRLFKKWIVNFECIVMILLNFEQPQLLCHIELLIHQLYRMSFTSIQKCFKTNEKPWKNRYYFHAI
jgi:hypothetical protein